MKKRGIDKTMAKCLTAQVAGGALITASAYGQMPSAVRIGVFSAGVGFASAGFIKGKERFIQLQEEKKYTTVR